MTAWRNGIREHLPICLNFNGNQYVTQFEAQLFRIILLLWLLVEVLEKITKIVADQGMKYLIFNVNS